MGKNKTLKSVFIKFTKQNQQHTKIRNCKILSHVVLFFQEIQMRANILFQKLFRQNASKIFSPVAYKKFLWNKLNVYILSSLWLPHNFQNFWCSWSYPSLSLSISFPPPLRILSSFLFPFSLPSPRQKRKQKKTAEKVRRWTNTFDNAIFVNSQWTS